VSATITIKIEVNDKHAEYTEYTEREFPGPNAEGTARDYYNRLIDSLGDGVELRDEPPEQFGPGYPKSELNPGGY
jgi:hypothetical protein